VLSTPTSGVASLALLDLFRYLNKITQNKFDEPTEVSKKRMSHFFIDHSQETEKNRSWLWLRILHEKLQDSR
jgi:hypothetical protein